MFPHRDIFGKSQERRRFVEEQVWNGRRVLTGTNPGAEAGMKGRSW